MFILKGEHFQKAREAFEADQPDCLNDAISKASTSGGWAEWCWALIKVEHAEGDYQELLYHAATYANAKCFYLVTSEVFEESHWKKLTPERKSELSVWFAFGIAEFFYESEKKGVVDRSQLDESLIALINVYLWKDSDQVSSSSELKMNLANTSKTLTDMSNEIAFVKLERHLLDAVALNSSGQRPRASL